MADLPVAYRYQAIAFMRTEWPSIFQGEDKFIMGTYPPALSPVHFVISAGEALVSYAEVLRLRFPQAGIEFQMYGFGNMFTFQPYRNEGFGKQVLALATNHIKNSDVDVAMLFCDKKLVPFYEKEGWEVTDSPTRIGDENEYEVYEPTRMMLFVSEHGQKNADAFTENPVYTESPW